MDSNCRLFEQKQYPLEKSKTKKYQSEKDRESQEKEEQLKRYVAVRERMVKEREDRNRIERTKQLEQYYLLWELLNTKKDNTLTIDEQERQEHERQERERQERERQEHERQERERQEHERQERERQERERQEQDKTALILMRSNAYKIYIKELVHNDSRSLWIEPVYENGVISVASGQKILIHGKHPSYTSQFIRKFSGYFTENKYMTFYNRLHVCNGKKYIIRMIIPQYGKLLKYNGKLIICMDQNCNICDLPKDIIERYQSDL